MSEVTVTFESDELAMTPMQRAAAPKKKKAKKKKGEAEREPAWKRRLKHRMG